VIHRPDGFGAFEFAVLASLRAMQLCRGCQPRIQGEHTVAVMAQMEIAGGAVGPATAADALPAVLELELPLPASQV
jgi:hypothetical protein